MAPANTGYELTTLAPSQQNAFLLGAQAIYQF